MSDNDTRPVEGRRGFLKLAGIGAVGAAAAAAAGAPGTAEAAGAETPDGKGYRETAHVRAFYQTARF